MLSQLVSEFLSVTSDDGIDVFRNGVTRRLSDQGANISISDFDSLMETLCKKQDMICFWYQFVTVDILAYLGLFTGVRYHNWDLRVTSIKLLAAVFSAFDTGS